MIDTPFTTTQYRLIKNGLGLCILLFLILVSFGLAQAQDTSSTPAPLCRQYSATTDNVAVRSCANTTCDGIASLNQGDAVCVVDSVEGWYELNLDPESANPRIGFVAQSLLVPGLVEQNAAGEYEFCNAYRIIPDEAIIRQCPSYDCNVLLTLTANTTVCAASYASDYANWIQIAGGINGQAAWVDMADFSGVREERSCEAWQVTSASTVARSCPDFFCDAVSTLEQGAEICAAGESESDQEWIGVYDSTGRFGWVFANIVEATTLASNEIYSQNDAVQATITAAQTLPPSPESTATASNPTALANSANCTEYQVTVDTAIIREQPSTDALQLNSFPLGTRVCVIGVVPYLENEWFIIDLSGEGYRQDRGFMSQLLLAPVNAPLPSPTASPIAPSGLNIVETPSLCTSGTNNTQSCVIAQPETGNAGVQAIDLALSPSLGSQIQLDSPQSNTRFRINIPKDWILQGQSILNLSFTYSESGDSSHLSRSPVTQVDIRLDNQIVQSIALDSDNLGVQNLIIPLPQAILANTVRTNHVLEMQLTVLDHCEERLVSRVLIDGNNSFVHLEYAETTPTLNLADYPRPFYEGHPSPERVYVVLPDNPDESTLSSAGRIVAGLGALASGLDVQTLTLSSISDELYRSNNLILVGLPTQHSRIADLYARQLLPTQLDSNQAIRSLAGEAYETDDGIIQIIQHPDDARFAILVVTGQSPTALLRAGQALGGQPTVIPLQNNLTVVRDALPAVRATANNTFATGMRFEDLGYLEDIVLNGIGEQSLYIDFFVPFGVITGDDAFVNLLYNSSTLLEQMGSTLTVSANDTPVASIVLEPSPEGNNAVFSTHQLQVNIPASTIIPGRRNYLRVSLNTQNLQDCQPYDNIATWLTISRDSEIFLPISIAERTANLVAYFPAPFNLVPALSDLVLSIPDEASSAEISQAMEILFRLGASAIDASGINPQIVRGFPENMVLSDYHIIIIGRPSNNSFFQEIAGYLPQPFVSGTDQLEQVFNNITYLLDESYDIGLIELISSPYNAERSILVLSGTNELTQAAAVTALAQEQFSSRELLGDIVFINGRLSYPINSLTIAQSFEILQAVPYLATESALLLQATTLPLTEIAASQPTLIPTTTPFMQATSGVTGNNSEVQGTAIIVIEPTEFALPPTATIAPIAAEDLIEPEAEQPALVQYLIIATIITGILGLVFRFWPFKSGKN